MAAVSALNACVYSEDSVASQTVLQSKPSVSNRKERVVLAGVAKGSSEAAINVKKPENLPEIPPRIPSSFTQAEKFRF